MMISGGGILAIEAAVEDHAPILATKLKLFRHATSLGGIESLVDHRWRYVQLVFELHVQQMYYFSLFSFHFFFNVHRWDKNVSRALLRLSIGLESPEDLIADFEQVRTSLNLRTQSPDMLF